MPTVLVHHRFGSLPVHLAAGSSLPDLIESNGIKEKLSNRSKFEDFFYIPSWLPIDLPSQTGFKTSSEVIMIISEEKDLKKEFSILSETSEIVHVSLGRVFVRKQMQIM